jgi:hypothetical protein
LETTKKLVKVELAFLFQLADLKADDPIPEDVSRKVFDAYDAAHKVVKRDYPALTSIRNTDGTSAYSLEAQAGFADPREGDKVLAFWFSSKADFQRIALVQLSALCNRALNDAAFERGIGCFFAGVRKFCHFEVVESADIL